MRSCPRSRGSGGLARFAGASGSKAVPRTGLNTLVRGLLPDRGVASWDLARWQGFLSDGQRWLLRSLPAASVSLALLHPATDTARVPSPPSPRRPPPQQSRPSPAGHLLLSSSCPPPCRPPSSSLRPSPPQIRAERPPPRVGRRGRTTRHCRHPAAGVASRRGRHQTVRESGLPGFQKERPETRAALWARAELRQRAPLPGEQGVRAGGSRGCGGLGRGSSPGPPRRSRCGGRVSLHSAQTGGEPGTPLSLRRKTAGGGDLRARVPRGTRPSAPRPARQAAPSVSGSSGSALCGRCPRPAAAEGDRSRGGRGEPQRQRLSAHALGALGPRHAAKAWNT